MNVNSKLPWYLPLLAAAVLLAGCPDKKKEEDKKEEAAVPVEVAPVTVGAIEAAYRGTATLEAEDEATVVAKQSGVIEQILVEEGDRVQAGAVLARLEAKRLRFQLAQTQAALDNAKANFQRNASVYQRKLIAREVYDKSQHDLESAQAAYDLTKLALEEAEIKAPIAGTVTARMIKVGNNIEQDSPAFRITRLDRLHAYIYVPERDIHKLAPGQSATLAVDAWPGRTFAGEILRINPVVDAASGTVKVTVAMATGQPALRPGMFGRIEILYDRHPQALLVPKDAVLTEDAAESVFVVSGGKALRRRVKLGYSDADSYEVLDGLKPGEQVVTAGQSSLKDNAKVEVVNAQPDPQAETKTAGTVKPQT